MTPDAARTVAQDEIDTAAQMNAGVAHAESAKRAHLAYIILDLANQIDASTPPVMDTAPTPEPAPPAQSSPPPAPKAKTLKAKKKK